MKEPLVSVVVPAYNYGRYLSNCIDSLLNQTYRNWELIVVDNGSTDDTWEVLNRYDDPRVIKLRIEHNDGPILAWDLGYRHCRGEYFALLPADDFFKPNKLERQISYLNEHPEITALGTYIEEVNDQGVPPEKKGYMEEYINQPIDYMDPANWRWKHYFCIPTALYSKQLCDAASAVPDHGLTSMCDWDFHVKLIGAGVRFEVLPEQLTCYRWHMKNTSLTSKNAYREWVYSHTKNYLPVIRRLSSDPLEEMATCMEMLYQNQAFINGYTHNQHCAMLEVMLNPEMVETTFTDYKSYYNYTEAWKMDSASRVAISSMVKQLLISSKWAADLHAQNHLNEHLFGIRDQMNHELEILRRKVRRLGKFSGFLNYRLRRIRAKLSKSGTDKSKHLS